jgi:hypothetical protein
MLNFARRHDKLQTEGQERRHGEKTFISHRFSSSSPGIETEANT